MTVCATSRHRPRVPESQFGRALGFASMGASLVLGTIGDNLSNALRGGTPAAKDGAPVYNQYITEANAERLASAL